MNVKKVVENNACPSKKKFNFHNTEFCFLADVKNALVQCQKIDLDQKKNGAL